jgi:glycosyltransferase involved in cell wall biosynthesis
MALVSVIIPVYNAQLYLNRCIDSVLDQTFKDFELILIDDGSTDSSLEILKQYEHHENVIVIAQENQGPALARNRGISVARGKYIMFIDSDDYVDNDYIESYVLKIEEEKSDVVMGGFTKVTGDHIDFKRIPNEGPFAKYIVTGPVSKIYNREFIVKHDISFLDTTGSEDVYFNMLFIKNGAKYSFIDNAGYYYFFNSSSLSNTSHKGFSKKVNILELLEKINFSDVENITIHQYFILRYVVFYLLHSGKTATADAFVSEYKKYFLWLKTNLSHYKRIRHYLFGPKGEDKKVGFIIFAFRCFHSLRMVPLFAKLYCKP